MGGTLLLFLLLSAQSALSCEKPQFSEYSCIGTKSGKSDPHVTFRGKQPPDGWCPDGITKRIVHVEILINPDHSWRVEIARTKEMVVRQVAFKGHDLSGPFRYSHSATFYFTTHDTIKRNATLSHSEDTQTKRDVFVFPMEPKVRLERGIKLILKYGSSKEYDLAIEQLWDDVNANSCHTHPVKKDGGGGSTAVPLSMMLGFSLSLVVFIIILVVVDLILFMKLRSTAPASLAEPPTAERIDYSQSQLNYNLADRTSRGSSSKKSNPKPLENTWNPEGTADQVETKIPDVVETENPVVDAFDPVERDKSTESTKSQSVNGKEKKSKKKVKKTKKGKHTAKITDKNEYDNTVRPRFLKSDTLNSFE